jgi:hypothetical protein
MFSLKKKLEAKNILFPLNKHLLSSIYELREITLDDSRRPKQSKNTIYSESAALVYFLVGSPVKFLKVPSSVEMFLLSVLKGVTCAFVMELEKDEAQQFIESRFADYYGDLEGGFNEAEICSKYLDFLGIVHGENDIIQNFSYTSFISSLFLFSMEILGSAKKNYKLIYSPISKKDLASQQEISLKISAQVQQAVSEHEEK